MIRLSLLTAAIVLMGAWTAAAQSSSGIAVTDAWARATPPGAKTGAAYITITNKGAASDQVVAASTPVAGMAQVHTTIVDNGVDKMRPVKSLDVKPGATVMMKPGGYHIMLMELKKPLMEGESFPLTVRFAKAGEVETTVKVAKIGASSAGEMNMKDMPGMNMK
ncbi:MAG TPA: copper chaperone PCu(A)C [Stellaceae bacterium]|nr:copper chaperone PCu(A)C [Stellaceae bacterium]